MQFLKNRFNLCVLMLSLTSCIGSKKTSSINNTNIKTEVATDTEIIKIIQDYPNYSVLMIENCGQNIATDSKKFSLFGTFDSNTKNQNLSNLNFSGWNHTTNGNQTEWSNLKLSSNNYNFNDVAKANSSCSNVPTLDMILVKKIADWNHQHANGFECKILDQGYKFEDIENLVFDIKINSAKTKIPSVQSLKSNYGSYLNNSVIDALDDGKVNIGITLGDNTNLNASFIFELDQVILSDKWLRVIIPMNKLSCYQEINYKKTPKTLADLMNIIINRMLIVGETKSGSVLRGKINVWNATVPETFKEMDLSFKKIEFHLK